MPFFCLSCPLHVSHYVLIHAALRHGVPLYSTTVARGSGLYRSGRGSAVLFTRGVELSAQAEGPSALFFSVFMLCAAVSMLRVVSMALV